MTPRYCKRTLETLDDPPPPDFCCHLMRQTLPREMRLPLAKVQAWETRYQWLTIAGNGSAAGQSPMPLLPLGPLDS
jgi:hypothetical protein